MWYLNQTVVSLIDHCITEKENKEHNVKIKYTKSNFIITSYVTCGNVNLVFMSLDRF